MYTFPGIDKVRLLGPMLCLGPLVPLPWQAHGGQQPALKLPKVGPAWSWNPWLPKGPFCFLMFSTKTRDILFFVFFLGKVGTFFGTCYMETISPDRRTICATWACGTLILC